jgi:aminopeptidase-like protein
VIHIGKDSARESVTELVRRLHPFEYSVNGEANDLAIPHFLEELPFTIHEFPGGAQLNGWVVPTRQKVVRADISYEGSVIYDGLPSPFSVIEGCSSFNGDIGLDELRDHLYFHTGNSSLVPWVCHQLYRADSKEWGFAVTEEFFDALKPGVYSVSIEVERQAGTMKVLDYTLPGARKDTLLLQAHNCHPYQANDGLSGCAVGIRVLQRLALESKREYTYRLLICPELIGTVHWLFALQGEFSRITAACILAACGNESPLRLQNSYLGNQEIDHVARSVFHDRYGHYEEGPFRTIYGNDETVFEAAGFEIPTISVTRYPFPQYHSNEDLPDRLSEYHLDDTVDTIFEICKRFDEGKRVLFTERGLICLSDPRYQLYRPAWNPALRHGPKDRETKRNWNLLMTNLPRLMDGKISVQSISTLYHLPETEVYAYCKLWIDRGLAQEI